MCGDWAESVGLRYGSTLVQAREATDGCTTGDASRRSKNRRKEIGAGLLAAMLRQLGLSRGDL